MNEAALHELVRKYLAEGLLPTDRVIRYHAGYGDGTACAVCDLTMEPADVAYELTFAERENVRSLVMHYRCFCIWERERRSAHAA
jgi:hypothetical protein